VTELASRSSPEVTYHDIRQARRSLAEARIIEPVHSFGRGQPYALTPWGRSAVGPLAAAAKWERDFLVGGSGAFTPAEGETLLLLALSLIGVLPGGLSGTCSLGLYEGHGIRVIVDGGRIVSSIPETADGCACRVSGTPSAWLEALLDGRRSGLEMSGSAMSLAAMLTAGLQEACS